MFSLRIPGRRLRWMWKGAARAGAQACTAAGALLECLQVAGRRESPTSATLLAW